MVFLFLCQRLFMLWWNNPLNDITTNHESIICWLTEWSYWPAGPLFFFFFTLVFSCWDWVCYQISDILGKSICWWPAWLALIFLPVLVSFECTPSCAIGSVIHKDTFSIFASATGWLLFSFTFFSRIFIIFQMIRFSL